MVGEVSKGKAINEPSALNHAEVKMVKKGFPLARRTIDVTEKACSHRLSSDVTSHLLVALVLPCKVVIFP